MANGTVNVSVKEDTAGFVRKDQVGIAGGLATLNDSGKLSAVQMPAIDHYTQAQTDTKIRDAVTAHNDATNAHPDIRASVNSLKATVQTIELKYGTSIKENAFQVSFETLDDVNAAGVWNQALATIEF